MAGKRAGAGDRVESRAERRPRLIAAVIILTFLGWMAATWLGGALGLPPGLALALDLVCLGVLGWALASLIGIWRMRRNEGR